MARESIATVVGIGPLVLAQIRAELGLKMRGMESVKDGDNLIVGKTSGLLSVHATNTECCEKARAMDAAQTHLWSEDFDMRHSLRSFLNWVEPRVWPAWHQIRIIVKSQDENIGKLLMSMTGKAFYSSDGNRGGYRVDTGDYIRRDTWENLLMGYSSYEKIDASNPLDMNRLRTLLGYKPVIMDKPQVVDEISECISSRLLQFINGNTKDEMVLGFVLKETGIRIPKEVHEQGLEALSKFIIDETNARLLKQFELFKAGQVSTPEVPKPSAGHKVFFNRTDYVRGTARFTRSDTQRMQVEVPDEVWRQAIADGSNEVIWTWIYDNEPESPVGSIQEGDEEFGDTLSSEVEDRENGRLENVDGTALRF